MSSLKISLLFIFFHFFTSSVSLCQIVTGKVTDANTGEALPFTNVFINNTTIGAITALDGTYEIKGQIPSNIELVASFVGYVTKVVEVNFENRTSVTVNFSLEPQQSMLSEVELKSRRDRVWERNLNRFEDVFIAVPDDPIGSKLVEILNPWVIDFEQVKVDKGTNYVKATAQEPIIIDNNALGYKIEFYLQDYRWSKTSSRYFGQVFYTEKKPKDEEEAAFWRENRESSYQGSSRHLIQSIILNQADSQGFRMYESKEYQLERVRTNSFNVEQGESIISFPVDSVRRASLRNGNFRIFWPKRVEIHYLKKYALNEYYSDFYHPISWIIAPGGYFDVYRDGIPAQPTQLVLSGRMGRQRVGRSLPYDFVPDLEFEDFVTEVDSSRRAFNKWNKLREQPYITTNKDFYYPGEGVWLGGRMIYQNQLLADSLSRVLYVDLLDEKSTVIQQEIFPIDSGRIAGGFTMPENLKQGNYFIRAYTQWMLNYSERDIFLRPIPVIEKGSEILTQQPAEIDYFGDLSIKLEKQVTSVPKGTEVQINLSILDELEQVTGAEFTVSITDADLVSPVSNRPTILDALEWLGEGETEDQTLAIIHQIEYGITVQGRLVRSRKRDPIINPITLVLNDLADYGLVYTDSSGYFRATGLNFTDSATLFGAALDSKKKSYGAIDLIQNISPTHRGSFPKLSYQLAQGKVGNQSYDIKGEFIQMEEFVKEDSEIERLQDSNYGYGEPDRKVTPEMLDNWPGSSLAAIVGMQFGNGKLGNFNYGINAGNPLIIIDGSRYLYAEGESYIDVLDRYITDEVTSLSIYTFNAPVFGMAGFAGVIMFETKRGERFGPSAETNFDSTGFQLFKIRGYTPVSAFENTISEDAPVQVRPTIYWDPKGEVTAENGVYLIKTLVSNEVQTVNLVIEGITKDGLGFVKTFQIKLKD
jgi:hypothetical protein